MNKAFLDIFYSAKPFIPRKLQLFFRRNIAVWKRRKHRDTWPIDPDSCRKPPGWPGWPDQKQFALVLSHDVDTKKGQDHVPDLAAIEMELGFRSAFNFVAERYTNHNSIKRYLKSKGFEINVHGLVHDGKLFKNKKIFDERAIKINRYLNAWGSTGFTSPSMHHRADWLHGLNITHSISTFDTDPFEPQSDGVGTIFPYWVPNPENGDGYVELPYTLPQDHLLFVILREKNIDVWRQKLDWVAQHGGMALLNSHSDYMNMGRRRFLDEEYPVEHYIEFLKYVKSAYSGRYFHTVPSEITAFMKENYRLPAMVSNPASQKPRNVVLRERLERKQRPENQWQEKYGPAGGREKFTQEKTCRP